MRATRPRDKRRSLPAVGRILSAPAVSRLIGLYGRGLVTVQARETLEELRRTLDTDGKEISADQISVDAVVGRLTGALAARTGTPPTRVLNATGVFLHTNLGRAPLPRGVAAELPALLDGYCDLELDLETGRRGQRNRRAARLLELLTGAESALVVNNNAAALLLVMAALARDREVVVSRGELVEIGGSFRIPEVLEAAGARLREVGTTNRTHLRDYEAAIGEQTALLLKVFPSNYRISGYATSVPPAALVALSSEHRLPLLVDEGSGLLRPHAASQLRDHPSFEQLVASGCDLVCGSGDKLLGGPQAGLIVGRAALVERLSRHPLYRALRPDRSSLAALDGVLRRHLAGGELPIDRLWSDPDEHRLRLERVAGQLGADLVPADAYLGGGSAPEAPIAGLALALPRDQELLAALRSSTPPVVGYVKQGRLYLDLRTIDPDDDAPLVASVLDAERRLSGTGGR